MRQHFSFEEILEGSQRKGQGQNRTRTNRTTEGRREACGNVVIMRSEMRTMGRPID